MNQLRAIAFCVISSLSGAVCAVDQADFSGYWLDCEHYQGSLVCSGYALKQKDTKVCGIGSSFATSSQYDSYIQGEVKAGSFVITSQCGSGTASACPKLSASNHAPLLQCGNRIYLTSKTSCEQAGKAKNSTLYRKVSAKKYIQELGEPDLSMCGNVL